MARNVYLPCASCGVSGVSMDLILLALQVVSLGSRDLYITCRQAT